VAITRADVQARINHITNNGSPIAANQALAQAGAIFAWAIKKGVVDLPANPAHGIERNATHRRERVLSEAELPLLCQAFDDVDPVRASALRLILLTGQRPGELQHMCWEHIDIGEHRLDDIDDRLLPWSELKRIVPYSRVHVGRLERSGHFPQHIALSTLLLGAAGRRGSRGSRVRCATG
jgi:integrase